MNMKQHAKYPISLLCIEDEPDVQEVLRRHLSSVVDICYLAGDGQEGYDMFNEHRPDVVITDLLMPLLDGLAMSRMIRAAAPKTPIILMTSCNRADFLEEAIDIGVTQFLPKPVLKEKLLTALQRCYDTIELERSIAEERERSEAHLLRSQKLESLGVLAGGVAHNFNNILTAIVGNAYLASIHLQEDSPVISYINNIEKSAERAAEVARQMLNYSGKGAMEIITLRLSDLLEDMRDMLNIMIPNHIKCIFELSKNRAVMKGDSSQIRQVVINLVSNAVEAIDNTVGRIRMSSGCIECNRDYLATCLFDDGAGAGKYVYLEISDTGCGMDKETVAKLFDPFFSTKFTGRGLGMAAVLGIVRWHKGAVHILSQPGEGSTCRILFPATTDDDDAAEKGEVA
jgi:signal transduction histidine kinase